jgi:uncharacterized protein
LTHPYEQSLIDRMHILQRSSPEILAAALISQDGLVIASALKTEQSSERISAMSASILSLGEQIGKETDLGKLEQVHIQGETGHVVLMAVGEKAVLTTVVEAQAKMGIILMDMRHATDDLLKILLRPEKDSE